MFLRGAFVVSPRCSQVERATGEKKHTHSFVALFSKLLRKVLTYPFFQLYILEEDAGVDSPTPIGL